MKHLLLFTFALLITATSATAQHNYGFTGDKIKRPTAPVYGETEFTKEKADKYLFEKYKMDSARFVRSFGTVTQYWYQKEIENKSSHKTLCVWIGAKPIWLYNFAIFLEMNGYDVTWKPSTERVEIIAYRNVSKGEAPLKVVAKLNRNGVIASADITGTVDDLATVYLGYWDLATLSVNQLKSKKKVQQFLASDETALDLSGSDPVIRVRQASAPDRRVDLFPL